MRGRRRYLRQLLVLGTLVLSFASCSDDANAPATPPITSDGQFHAVRFADPASQTVRFSARRSPIRPTAPAAEDPASPAGDQLAFWAYTDRDASFSINRETGEGTSLRVVSLRVPRGSLFRRPDGSEFAPHDSIQIAVSLDQQDIRLDLEPSGLRFNPLVPAQLTISYQEANPDFNGDGVVNFVDDYIEQVLLGIRTRQGPLDPWQPIPARNDIMSHELSSDLQHFTGYAVSW